MADRAKELRESSSKSDQATDLRETAEGSSFGSDLVYGLDAGLRKPVSMLGVEQRQSPDSLGGRIGEVAGEAATFALPFGAAASRVSAAEKSARGSIPAIQNFLSGVGASFRARPTAFVAAEGGLGGLAGGGGYIAEQNFPDSEGARFVGEVLGGLSPALTSMTVGGAASLTKKALNATPVGGPLYRGLQNTVKGAQRLRDPMATKGRAQDRFSRATESPESASESMDLEFLEGLTPAAKTGDEGLMRLESAVNRELDDSEQFISRSIQEVQGNVRRAISEFGEVPVSATEQTFEQAQDRLRAILDERVLLAAKKAEQSLSNMSPNVSREIANESAASQIRNALNDLRGQESSLYDLIPEDAVVPTSSVKRTYRNLMVDLSEAEKDDMPNIAKRLLGRDGRLGQVTDIKELRGLQSRLRREARNARTGDKASFNKARIADSMADSITEDISNAEGGEAVSGAVRTAVNFSRDLNQRFRQGTVGDLLGYSAAGDARTPSGLFLEKSIGGGGPNSRQAYDDILKASSNRDVKDSMEAFIRNKFFDFSVRNGEINPSAAQTFMRSNKEILKRTPRIALEIDQAIKFNDVTDIRAKRRDAVAKGLRPSVNKASMFIENGPDRAFTDVLRSRRPSMEMTNLVRMAKRDETGEAAIGLKKAFSDYLVKRSSSSDGNISGVRLSRMMDDDATQKAMTTLYSSAEVNRWNTIKRTLNRLDQQTAATPSREGVLGDTPGKVTTVLARLLGAATGTRIARLTGAGGIQSEAIMSQSYKNLLQKGLDPARKLIEDSVQDEKLFKELLMQKIPEGGKVPKEVRLRLNAWIATLEMDEDE